MLEVFLLLVFAHCLADFALQTDWVVSAKSPLGQLPSWAAGSDVKWWYVMGAHCVIHGGFVGIITGFWWLGVAEFVTHFFIDWLKCKRYINFLFDQCLHLAYKVVWAAVCCKYLEYLYSNGGVQ